jgi:N-acetylneuraminic acid mutarotase
MTLRCSLILVGSLLGTIYPTGVRSLKAEWIPWTGVRQNITPRRSGHTAFVHDGTTPYVFGGYVEQDGKDQKLDRHVTADLWKWSAEKNEWKSLPQTGDIPGPRLCSAAAVLHNKAYLFGGWDPQTEGTGGIILDSIHELDLDNDSEDGANWKELDTTLPDGPTSRHVAVSLVARNLILVHTHRCVGYVLLFDPLTKIFTKQPTTGPCPTSRGLHAATVLMDDTVVLFGGAAQDQTMSNEAFVLDTVQWKWSRIDCNNGDQQGPSARAGPCICAYDSDSVVVFGGAEATATGLHPRGDVWALSLEKNQWELLIDDNDNGESRPPPRNAASLTQINLEGKTGKGFLLNGGWAPFRQTWDDCFLLHVHD